MNGNAKEPAYIHDSDDDSEVKHSNCSKDVAISTCVKANYISDDEDEDLGEPNKTPVTGNRLCQSKRVMEQLRANEKDDPQRIVMLVANATERILCGSNN